jgi:hypothetical protein
MAETGQALPGRHKKQFTTFRFKALMTPMRANIVGPPSVATRIRASIAACHSGGIVLGFRESGDIVAGILEGDKLAAAGAF